MAWVTIKDGQFKCRFTALLIFNLKLLCGNHLYNNPDDEEVAALYKVLPEPTRSKYGYIGGMKNLMLDTVHLSALKKMLPKVLNGGWTKNKVVMTRLRSFDEIPALQLLATALGDD